MAVALAVALLSVPKHVHADSQVDASVSYWSAAYGVSSAYVERVIACESGGDVNAMNPSGVVGVLQYKPATFYAIQASELSDASLAPGLSVYDPERRGVWSYDAQIHLFCWLLYTGGYTAIARQWACV